LFVFAYNNEVKAVFELKDQLKKDAKKSIQKIQDLNIKTIMLTGDNEKVASIISKEAGIQTYYANLLPQDKLNIVEKLQKDGKIVVMAGDGINDSLALAKSNIAIAMGSGADIAIGVSDVVLMDDSPKNLYLAYKISKRSFLSVKENLSLSVVYNIIAIPLAVGGFVNPLVAALSMSLSSLIVVGNSFRGSIQNFN
jgi:Cu+-exporting ATPase